MGDRTYPIVARAVQISNARSITQRPKVKWKVTVSFYTGNLHPSMATFPGLNMVNPRLTPQGTAVATPPT